VTQPPGPATLDRRIRSELEARIRSGEWPPGHRIPFEHELVAAFGCSRATVNKAVSALVAAGLVERRKRAGSFVAQPPVHAAMLEIPDIANVLAARGERYRFHLLARELGPTPLVAELAEAAEIGPPSLVLVGLHVAGDQPFAHELRVIDLGEVPEAATVDFGAEAPGSWLLKHVPWSEARHRITAVNPAPAVAAALRISRSAACLRIERSTRRLGRPVTAVVQIFPGDRYDLVGQFTPADRPPERDRPL